MRRPRVALFLVCALAAGFLGACNQKSVSSSDGDRIHPKAGDVFLEAFDDAGSFPFTVSVALAPVPAVSAGSVSGGSSTQGLRSVAGTTPRLYGGSGSQQLCDATTAVNLLADHQDAAQAWVDALNADADLSWSGGSKLAVEDIATYVGELTSLVVQNDTRVTDYALSGSKADAFQSVLQRGTAVMVDARGVPRARCASFSPLTAPSPATSPKYRGTKWQKFDPHQLVAVTPGHQADTFVVLDVHTHKQIELFGGQACLCDRTKQSTTTSTTELESTTSTSTKSLTPTTTKVKPTTTTARPTTTTASTTPPTPGATTTTAP